MPNGLAHAQSPYLRQHADNPVDWQEWGEPAFARARAENKPIFLSIGYSTCHWCHVMAHESFENEEIAAVLNDGFVAIKVDREVRPDVDRVYMTYVQAMTGHGGWPLSAWLTPELKPFYGGTYFPPADRGGRPGFATLLRAISAGWRDPAQRAQLVAEGSRAIDALKEHAAGREASAAAPVAGETDSTAELLDAAQAAYERGYLYFYENYNAQNGGFGSAPKFPRASVLTFLFRCADIQGHASETGAEALRMAAHTLRAMARGGIHDHVGGGFHRYSVDAGWFVPHFEKMLYDQAQIAVNSLEARQATGDERYGWLARDILDYVLRDLTHPEGGFYSAEDADSLVTADRPDHAEGAFYVWSAADFAATVGAEHASWLARHFGVTEAGNVPAELDPHHEFSGRNILIQRQPVGATAQALGRDPEQVNLQVIDALGRLREVRHRRPRPHLDHKVITSWNGLMLSALAQAHVGLERSNDSGETRYLSAALAAAGFLHRNLYDATRGVLFRTFGTSRGGSEGFAEDYACLTAGLLDLYEASHDEAWLKWAVQLQTTMDRLFWDEDRGGYFSAPADDPNLVLRLKEDYDGAEPAPSSVAASNLLRLSDWLHEDSLKARALRTLKAFQGQWTQHPQALPAMLTAVERALARKRHVVLVGSRNA
ncbi:MAG: thioredoxin domain-containing protein, partial [Opitutaceae bacterium]|nr:thioredoxin domain-containing protein [Opitutaceae bacterium]